MIKAITFLAAIGAATLFSFGFFLLFHILLFNINDKRKSKARRGENLALSKKPYASENKRKR